MTTLQDVINAYRGIDAARQKYRQVLRQALAERAVQQVDVSKALGRTREMIRRDAMTDDKLAELRQADLDRKHGRAGGE